MFNIVLYKFSKKTNSMKQPSGSTPSVTYKCIAREDASIISPVILIEDQTDDVINYNYAYIADWGKRYYFVRDVVLVNGNHLYQLDLNVDVLATYRSDIRNSQQFVLRSASSYNTNLIDSMYDIEGQKQSGSKNFFGTVGKLPTGAVTYANYFNTDLSSGYFVIGVIGDNSTGITYYSLSYSTFKVVVDRLMNYVPTDMSDVSNGIAKALADPLQYVTSCLWFPVIPTAASTTTTITFGGYTIILGDYAGILGDSLIQGYYCDVDVPKHPQASGRGQYMNLSPYSYYTMDFQPFGTFSLDAFKLYGCGKVRSYWFCDFSTGTGLLKTYALDTSGSGGIYPALGYKEVALLASATAQIGVPIQLSQLTINVNKVASTIMTGIASSVIPMLQTSAKIAAAAGGAKAAISGAAILASPDVSSAGATGSLIAYKSIKPCIYAQFSELAGPDFDRFGRPLEEKATISTLSGYCRTQNATLVYYMLTPTDTEAEMVNSLMDEGFYIE